MIVIILFLDFIQAVDEMSNVIHQEEFAMRQTLKDLLMNFALPFRIKPLNTVRL